MNRMVFSSDLFPDKYVVSQTPNAVWIGETWWYDHEPLEFSPNSLMWLGDRNNNPHKLALVGKALEWLAAIPAPVTPIFEWRVMRWDDENELATIDYIDKSKEVLNHFSMGADLRIYSREELADLARVYTEISEFLVSSQVQIPAA